MDFTREPIIETIITPKEGYKLVIRSSKGTGQEEYLVDALEIVAFGHALFFRSLEKPKAFLFPVTDYEVLEAREARMVLKNVGLDRSIKIGGGREGNFKAMREGEKTENLSIEEGAVEQEEVQPAAEVPLESRPEIRVDKKRDRRRHYRKRRGREEGVKEAAEPTVPPLEDEKISLPPPEEGAQILSEETSVTTSSLFSSLLQPPPTLISETIGRYRQNELFKAAFYLTEEEQYKPHDKVQELLNEEDEEIMPLSLPEPTFVSNEEYGESLVRPSPTGEEPSLEELQLKKECEDEEAKIEEGGMQPAFIFSEEREESQFSLPLYAQEEDVNFAVDSNPEKEEKNEADSVNHHSTSQEEN